MTQFVGDNCMIDLNNQFSLPGAAVYLMIIYLHQKYLLGLLIDPAPRTSRSNCEVLRTQCSQYHFELRPGQTKYMQYTHALCQIHAPNQLCVLTPAHS